MTRPKQMKLREVLAETVKRWFAGRAPSQSAALAFYTLFSLAPVLVVVLSIASAVFGEDATRREIESQVQRLMGPQTAELVFEILHSADRPELAGWAGIIGLFTLLLGATAIFAQLQEALNNVWGVKPDDGPKLTAFLIKRLLSFGLVVSMGFLLLVSLLLSAGISAISDYALGRWQASAPLFAVIDVVLSVALITLLFAIMFRVLPDARIAWRDVGVGAFVTALMFTIGKWLIGAYLGRSDVASVYGVAGSLVISLLWIYYASMILLAGAGFTQVWSERNRSGGASPEPWAKVDPTAEIVTQDG